MSLPPAVDDQDVVGLAVGDLDLGGQPERPRRGPAPTTLIMSLPLVPLTITVGRPSPSPAAARAGQVDVDLLDVGAGRSLTVICVGAAQRVELDGLDRR